MFNSLFGGFADDPFFGPHIRQHMGMMQSPLSGLLGGMPGMSSFMPALTQGPLQQQQALSMRNPLAPFGMAFMPGDMGMMANMGNGASMQSFSSSTVYSYNDGGKPVVYRQSTSSKTNPTGIRETRKTIEDSRTGSRKITIGHHIGDRAHIKTQAKNVITGDEEEEEELVNIDEGEEVVFAEEWKAKAHHAGASRGQHSRRARMAALPYHGHQRTDKEK